MTLRKQILLRMSLVLIGLIAGLYMTSRNIFLHDSKTVELQSVKSDTNQILNLLDVEMCKLELTADDWTNSYASLNPDNENPDYVRKGLTGKSLSRSGINLAVIINPNGKVVYYADSDRIAETPNNVSPLLMEHLSRNKLLVNPPVGEAGVRGFISVSRSVFMVVSRKVQHGSTSNTQHATVIVGRHFDSNLLNGIADQMKLSGKTRLILPGKNLDFQQEAGSTLRRNPITNIEIKDGNTIQGSTILYDIYGSPIAKIISDHPRTAYKQSKATMDFYLGSLLVIGVLFSLLLEVLLEKYIISRISTLSKSVYGIAEEGDLSSRVELPGEDELSGLAHSVNKMLSNLQISHEELRKQEALRESEERYSKLLSMSPDAVMIIKEGRLVYVNTAACSLLGCDNPEMLIGVDIMEKVHPHYHSLLQEQIKHLFRGMEVMMRIEARMVKSDGSLINVEVAGILLSYQGKPAVQIVARDITEMKDYEEKLDHIAHYDPLTDLPNRMLFSDHLYRKLSCHLHPQDMVAVMFLDIDRFKLINDTLGHNTGDLLLKNIAERLLGSLRGIDIMARMGGDEFTIIVPDLSSIGDAIRVAKRAIEALKDPFHINGHDLFITVSIGISLYPIDGRDVETLVKNADAAMYRAKELGGNNYHLYTEELEVAAAEKMTLESDLRKALEKEEFILHYQPRVDLDSGDILGIEALVRWKHPKYGLISPSQFISIAEETNLIVPLSEWVIKTACMQNKSWQDSGYPPVSIAVNVSARHLQQGNLIATIKQILKETDLKAEYLEIEVTESTLMQNMENAQRILQEIRSMGVHISVDDFGTGYSSLAYLKSLPLTTIKIDQSFVKEINTNTDDAAIAEAVIAMAHSMNLNVIAEGVETLEQLEFLRSLKCDEIQGYFISRPLSADEFTLFLKEQHDSSKYKAA